ncbi:hypothetical protein D5S17_18920 [Pseudonocardiaceae bacterium YIM PH 21723]|nr:hypothetical protein D5S17_18920 [Pseudonocardiaceae bacterium YIM PH 21723]
MREVIESLPGHEGYLDSSDGYVAGCGCGWRDQQRFPERQGAVENWWRSHLAGALNTQPPEWLLVKSDVLKEQIEILLQKYPRAALALLAEVDGWRRPLVEQAARTARQHGESWSTIGAALGISRQAAHERFGP